MKSGEDVIGEVEHTKEGIIIEKPVVLMQMPGDRGQIQMGMVPWQPFSKSDKFSISKEWVVTISDPAEDIENGYRKQFGSGIDLPTSQLLTG
tara:strand:- start:1389 stop:1664 length:276 start_codon:yes stop_codon:yes gene_type:complete